MDDRRRLLCCSFNQDHSCFSIGTSTGFRIYNCDACSCCYENAEGGVGIVEMFFSSSLVALVGAGEQPEFSPRRLFIYNTTTGVRPAELDFISSVLAVRWNKKRLIVVLDRKTMIRDLPELKLLGSIEACNSKGLCAFSVNEDNCYLALPASDTTGSMLVYDALNMHALGEIQAHRSPLAAMAFSADGLVLATASEQGTVIRVHAIPQASKVFTFRRGSYQAAIYSLSFGPCLAPRILAATSSSGTLHIFRLCSSPRQGNNSVVSNFLSAVMPHVSDIVDPEHHIAVVRHSFTPGVRSFCAIARPSDEEGVTSSSERARIFVVTADGFFNEYRFRMTANGEGECALEREFSLLSASDQISARFV